MIPDNVTLIVKAPNQQIEDQNVECLSSWTVRQLKGHLSEVYPSKPTVTDQKIIYSGQLLDDNAVIKDILRTYDTQFAHTMHLVCSSKRAEVKEVSRDVTEVSSDEGLRRRNVVAAETPEVPAENVNRPETRQNDQNHTVEMQNYISSFVNNYGRVPPYQGNFNFGFNLPAGGAPAPAHAQHILLAQQAYAHYMQQYAHMWQGGAMPAQPNVPVNETPVQPPPQPEPPIEDEENRRDWLDHVYAASRLAILFSLVYVYSSPLRLLLVAALAAAAYLHQVGFFRDLAVNQPLPAPQQPANGNNANVAANNVPNNVANDNVTADNANTTETVTNVNNNEENESFLSVTWLIVTSFLSSLVPDMNQV